MNDNNDVPAETTTEVQQLDSGNSSTNNNNSVLFDEANDKYENEFKSQMTRHSPAGGEVGE